MATLKVEIVTPEAALWVGQAKALVARSADGEFMILPQHTATVGDVVAVSAMPDQWTRALRAASEQVASGHSAEDLAAYAIDGANVSHCLKPPNAWRI